MKVLIWSDIHLHNWPYGSKLVNSVNSRLLAQGRVMGRIAKYIRENPVGHIVFLGDLFHTHGKIDASVLKVAHEGITEIMDATNGTRVQMDMLVGNHDTDRKDLSVHALHWLNSIPGVNVIDDVWHDRELGFSYLSYTENEDVLKKFFRMSQPICFMHQGMVDVPMASSFVVNEIMNYDMIPDHVRHVFTGHYHPFRLVGEKATVVGSTMQHTWADMGDIRGWVVVDTDIPGSICHINSHAPEFRTVDMNSCSTITPSTGQAGSVHSFDTTYFRNNYLRAINFPEGAISNLRKEILAYGALSLEFVIKPKLYKSTVVKAITGKGLSVPELVREYEKEHSVSEERSNIGKELMK